jgi:dephospho-CoA kinase
MLKVGITGGIGSGKSVVSRVFRTLGIPIFNADDAARFLMEHSDEVVAAVKKTFGEEVYVNGKLNRVLMADLVYTDRAMLDKLNAIVHPATIKYAKTWVESHHSAYTLKEAALFFESGTSKEMDIIIGVSAPIEIRIARAMARNDKTREQVERIVAMQMDETEKMNNCQHVIVNDGQTAVLPQVLSLHRIFFSKSLSHYDI